MIDGSREQPERDDRHEAPRWIRRTPKATVSP